MKNNFAKSDFASLPEVERINALSASGKQIERYSYSKPLTDEDIAKKNVKINEALERVIELKEDRKDIGAEIKEQEEIIAENHKHVIGKYVSVREKVWEVVDTEAGVIEIINKDGDVIESKFIKSGTQLNMFRQAKDAV